MYWDITTAEHVDGYRIRVHFRDGKSGVVDLAPHVEKGGVFERLADEAAFKEFRVDPDWHVLTWDNGRIDIAPETIYEEATGEATLPHVAEERASYGNQ